MKTFASCLASLFLAASAAAQTSARAPVPLPERGVSSPNLNLRLDEGTRRSVLREEPSEQRAKAGAAGKAALPGLGAESGRSFDTPAGARPKSSSGGPFPKTIDTP